MRWLSKSIFAMFTLAISISQSMDAHALAKAPKLDSQKISQEIFSIYNQTPSEAALKKLLKQIYRSFDKNNKGISKSEVELFQKINEAKAKSFTIQNLLASDLDGDLIVSEEELREVWVLEKTSQQIDELANITDFTSEKFQEHLEFKAGYDANKNGIFDPEDFASIKPGYPYQRNDQIFAFLGVLMKNDPNADGVLERTEAEIILSKAYPNYEFGKVAEKQNNASGKYAHCNVPKAGQNTEVIAFGLYSGAGLSTVSVAGTDKTTNIANVFIEPGEHKLFLVLSSYRALIWSFSGSVDRIEHIIFNAPNFYNPEGHKVIEVGATGLNNLGKEKISFIPSGFCLSSFVNDVGFARSKAEFAIKEMTGAKTIQMSVAKIVSKVSFPSGKQEYSENNRTLGVGKRGLIRESGKEITVDMHRPDGATDRVVIRDKTDQKPLQGEIDLAFPAGIVELNPKEVIAAGKAQSYELLPGVAGLSQLVDRGDIERIKDTRHFAINRKIKFPPGLSNYSGKFLLKKGVPVPNGELKFSCLFSEEKKEYLWGRCKKGS